MFLVPYTVIDVFFCVLSLQLFKLEENMHKYTHRSTLSEDVFLPGS